MKIFIIQPHSFVDLITNSSSEVFVMSKDKIKDFLSNAFSGVEEPWECQMNIEISKFPNYRLLKQYHSFGDYADDLEMGIERFYDSPEYKEYCNPNTKNLSNEDRVNLYRECRNKFENRTHFTENRNKITNEYYEWIAAQNGMTLLDLENAKNNEDNDLHKEASLIYLSIDYDLEVVKGDFIIESEGDNSIPYEEMEMIENLSKSRYHIG